jgi:transposase-like protein
MVTVTPASDVFNGLSERVLEALLAGASIEDAARTAGCSARTLKRWLAAGRSEPDGPYAAFVEAVDSRRKLVPDAGVPDRQETLQLLSTAARRGSVPAMRELMRYHERAASEPTGPLHYLDELAGRRDR